MIGTKRKLFVAQPSKVVRKPNRQVLRRDAAVTFQHTARLADRFARVLSCLPDEVQEFGTISAHVILGGSGGNLEHRGV